MTHITYLWPVKKKRSLLLEKSLLQVYGSLGYLDDIVYIWTAGLEKLKEFFGFLNNFQTSIKFIVD